MQTRREGGKKEKKRVEKRARVSHTAKRAAEKPAWAFPRPQYTHTTEFRFLNL